jgi:N-acetylmuramoyl-L-alanine amidase
MSQASAPSTAPASSPARAIDLIVVHCSATPSGKALGTGRRSPAAQVIDGWHKQRGFARSPAAVAEYNTGLPHIGYHYVIDVDGLVQCGRRLAEVGAHVKGHNAKSIGICLVGGAEPVAAYTAAQWSSLTYLVNTLRLQRPLARVVGHRDLSSDANADGRVQVHEWLKTCPGFDVQAWMANGCTPLAGQVMDKAP